MGAGGGGAGWAAKDTLTRWGRWVGVARRAGVHSIGDWRGEDIGPTGHVRVTIGSAGGFASGGYSTRGERSECLRPRAGAGSCRVPCTSALPARGCLGQGQGEGSGWGQRSAPTVGRRAGAGTGEADTWLPASGGEAPCEAWSGLDSGRVWPSTETGVCVGGPAEAGGMGRGPRASWAVRQRMAQGHLEGSKVGRPCGSQCVRWSP